MNSASVTFGVCLSRTEIPISAGSFANRDFHVLPAVMLISGAYTPAIEGEDEAVPLYFSKEDIAASLNSWNGRPISLYHPRGEASCNIPSVLDSQWIGYVFNTVYSDDEGKLRADLWLDKDRGQFIVDKISKGDNIELSVGAFGDIIKCSGTSKDVKYDYKMTKIIGDHLAVLPDIKGACSWEDGCGIRMQKTESDNCNCVRDIARKVSYDGVESVSWEAIGKTLEDYISAYYKQTSEPMSKDIPTTVKALDVKARRWISSKTLLGEASALTERDLIFFPVVNPSSGKLNEGALNAVISGRGSQANISPGSKASAQDMARRLLESEFKKNRNKMEEKNVVKAEDKCEESNFEITVSQKDVSMAEFLNNAPVEIKATLSEAMKEREEQRAAIINAINVYEKIAFCSKFLEETGTKELKAIASLVGVATAKENNNNTKAVGTVDYSLKSNAEVSTGVRCEAPELKL